MKSRLHLIGRIWIGEIIDSRPTDFRIDPLDLFNRKPVLILKV